MPAVEMVLPSLEMGGMEQVVCRLARGLRARGWGVGVTCTLLEGELAPALRADGIGVHLVPLRGAGPWLGAGPLADHLRRIRPDVVHSHSGVWWRAVAAAARAGVSARVHTVHGLLQHEPWFGPLEKHLAARLTGAVVAVSPALRAYLEHRARVAPARLHLVGNGVDTGLFRPAPHDQRRRALGIGPGALVLGAVARLDPVKRLDLAFGPLAELAAGGVDAHFVIAGDGPDRARLEQAAHQAGVRSRVHFLGTVAESATLYPEFDLFLLPSDMEGTSLSLLEAMASAVPCVATAVGGNPAVLDGGAAGCLVPPGDAPALRAAIARLWADPPARRQLGRAGRERVVAHYSLDTMIARYQELYETQLAGSR